ncbi:MAG: AsmA family protein [Burkholderiaceae bacterium]|nr:AsmA family protein [Burkholderiaceae bacterium]
MTAVDPSRPPPVDAAPAARRRRWRLALLLVVALGAAGLAIGEGLGWPFLAGPLERMASRALGRPVQMRADDSPGAAPSSPWRLRFIGGLRLSTPRLFIAAPDWSSAPHLLLAHDVQLELRYRDLWRARRGELLRVHRLQAARLDARLERRTDSRASWQFDTATPPGHLTQDPHVPVFEWLQVASGRVTLHDEPSAIALAAELTLVEGVASESSAAGLKLHASGSFRQTPLRLTLTSAGLLPWVAPSDRSAAVPLTLTLVVGRSSLDFQGTAQDARHLAGLRGRYQLRGPSLAAVGDPLGVTLPTTGAFRTVGRLVKQGPAWQVLVDDATVGSSQLNGAFSYAPGTRVPLLAGRLGGRRLMLVDLAPTIGAEAASRPATGRARKLLPDKPFDLAALRSMDANVQIAIDEVDLNHPRLRPLRPLKGHLALTGGVLRLQDLDARTAQGRLRGDLQLDGRGDEALWRAQLAWHGVQLEQWIAQPRDKGGPPFIAGRLQGQADVSGHGRSTAAILASLSGPLRTELRRGAVSHLAIEAAGLDLAEGLGIMLKGDDALQVQCAVASLQAENGVLRPKLMVLDTADSTIWVDGSLSLATETMDLRAVVTPKDFSPLTLRAPLTVRGPFTAPVVSVDKRVAGAKLAASVLLAFVNPLAALIPLVDPGDSDEARQAASGCQALVQRAKSKRPAPDGAKNPADRR